jgi:hypothetical protein
LNCVQSLKPKNPTIRQRLGQKTCLKKRDFSQGAKAHFRP